MNYKASIGYYYPTSPGAEFFKKTASGCYGLSFIDEAGKEILFKSFDTDKEAYEFSDKLGIEYDRYDIREYHKRQNKEAVASNIK